MGGEILSLSFSSVFPLPTCWDQNLRAVPAPTEDLDLFSLQRAGCSLLVPGWGWEGQKEEKVLGPSGRAPVLSSSRLSDRTLLIGS
jgi:hypothetical protein